MQLPSIIIVISKIIIPISNQNDINSQ